MSAVTPDTICYGCYEYDLDEKMRTLRTVVLAHVSHGRQKDGKGEMQKAVGSDHVAHGLRCVFTRMCYQGAVKMGTAWLWAGSCGAP